MKPNETYGLRLSRTVTNTSIQLTTIEVVVWSFSVKRANNADIVSSLYGGSKFQGERDGKIKRRITEVEKKTMQ